MTDDGREATIKSKVDAYYTAKLATHGATARGVDWNGVDSQRLRFEQLAQLWSGDTDFTICDYGCGYGSLLDHLSERDTPFSSYLGVDLSEPMVGAAGERWQHEPRARFITGDAPDSTVDYLVASGVMNVKLDIDTAAWEGYVHRMIDRFAGITRKGFAFNALTAHSDADRKRPDLWYADPGVLLNQLVDPHRRFVRLLHDYPLFEFTVLVWHRQQPD